MICKKILFNLLVILFSILLVITVFKTIKMIPQSYYYLTKDCAKTNGIVVDKKNSNVYIVTYQVEGSNITSSYNGIGSLINKKGEEIEITYVKSNPSQILSFDYSIILDLFFLYVLYVFISKTPYFMSIFLKCKSKKWDLKMCKFVSTELTYDSAYVNFVILRFSYEEGEKQKIDSIICNSLLIKILIENDIIDKVPIKFNPKNKDEKCLDYEYIEKLVDVKKSII